MAVKTFIYFATVMFFVLLVQAEPNQEAVDVQRPDILFIQNPDTAPVILSPLAALLDAPHRNNLVCTAAMCRSVCNALGFRFGRCNANRVCVCSNS